MSSLKKLIAFVDNVSKVNSDDSKAVVTTTTTTSSETLIPAQPEEKKMDTEHTPEREVGCDLLAAPTLTIILSVIGGEGELPRHCGDGVCVF